MRRSFRALAVLCAVIAFAALTAAFVSGDTEPVVSDVVLDGAIRPSFSEPEMAQDDVADAPRTGVEVEQIQPAPTVAPPTPAAVDAVVAPPSEAPTRVAPAVILIPPADDPADEPPDEVEPGGDAEPDD